MGGGEEGRNGFSFPPHLPFYGRGKGEGGGRGESEMPVKRMTRMIHNHNNTRCDEKDRAVVRKTGKERDGGDALILLPSSLLCFFSFSVLRFVESCAQNVRSSCSVCCIPGGVPRSFPFWQLPTLPIVSFVSRAGTHFSSPAANFPLSFALFLLCLSWDQVLKSAFFLFSFFGPHFSSCRPRFQSSCTAFAAQCSLHFCVLVFLSPWDLPPPI